MMINFTTLDLPNISRLQLADPHTAAKPRSKARTVSQFSAPTEKINIIDFLVQMMKISRREFCKRASTLAGLLGLNPNPLSTLPQAPNKAKTQLQILESEPDFCWQFLSPVRQIHPQIFLKISSGEIKGQDLQNLIDNAPLSDSFLKLIHALRTSDISSLTVNDCHTVAWVKACMQRYQGAEESAAYNLLTELTIGRHGITIEDIPALESIDIHLGRLYTASCTNTANSPAKLTQELAQPGDFHRYLIRTGGGAEDQLEHYLDLHQALDS